MKTVIEMAREAGMNLTPAQFSGVLEDEIDEFQLERFAELVRADERARMAEQPARLPFGVGGGLVAIKTLLSRDPCVHANTAIQMIDAILAEQPAQQEPVANIPGLAADESAFIRWALKNKYDTSSHPMFFVMLDPKTYEARMGWKAAVAHYALDTAPQPAQRTWVELTKGEIESWNLPENATLVDIAWFIEEKIKEKNT